MRRIFSVLLLFVLAFSTADSFSQGVSADTAKVYRTIEDAMKSPGDVTRLSLKGRRLTEVPAEVFLLTNLQELDLSRNRIDSLPAAIGSLLQLQSLDLSNNQLDTLPAELGNLSSLVYLGLNRNRIRHLPEEIGGLSSLEVLELWDNELEEIPEDIAKLQNLRVLELRGILLSQEEQSRIDQMVVKSAKVFMSPACNCQK